ncbi:hypothetical protein IV203_009385 [Nitzschia inconspicua]|uniref:CRAL-TRIO domain-containing protein n=1 Tax=Nitzschia inconspicua TaxID=303405 RepID=A0A9K3PNK6_9STRA|nr:hypothetical protein IV203_009385 [Nitzschia inconspicua]
MPVFSFTAPLITPEEEALERENLSKEQKAELQEDLYGGIGCGWTKALDYVEQNDGFLTTKLQELEQALSEMTPSLLKDYNKAMETVPDIVQTESDPVKFLRCERYDVTAAAKRIQLYWKMRRKIFGDDRAFLPMTLHAAMKDDAPMIESLAIYNILPEDAHGRKVLFFDRIKIVPPQVDRDLALRCMFYMIQVISEDVHAQKHGFVCLNNMKGYDLYKNFDRLFFKQASILMVECMPTKTKAYHLLAGSENGVMSLVLPVKKHIAAKELRLRMVVHFGTDYKIVDSLKPFGLNSKNVSHVVGGDFTEAEWTKWLSDRKETESLSEMNC